MEEDNEKCKKNMVSMKYRLVRLYVLFSQALEKN